MLPIVVGPKTMFGEYKSTISGYVLLPESIPQLESQGYDVYYRKTGKDRPREEVTPNKWTLGDLPYLSQAKKELLYEAEEAGRSQRRKEFEAMGKPMPTFPEASQFPSDPKFQVTDSLFDEYSYGIKYDLRQHLWLAKSLPHLQAIADFLRDATANRITLSGVSEYDRVLHKTEVFEWNEENEPIRAAWCIAIFVSIASIVFSLQRPSNWPDSLAKEQRVPGDGTDAR